MKLLLGAAAALVSTLLVPTSAHAHAGAPSRPASHLTYLAGTTLHTPSGQLIHLRLPKGTGNYAELFGQSADGGWVVQGGNGVFYDVDDHGTARRIASGDWSDVYVTRLLAADGASVWESVPDQGDDVAVFAHGLVKHKMPYVSYDGDSGVGEVLAAEGDHAWLGGDHLFLVNDDSTTTVLDRRGASLVDVDHDLVFLQDPHGLIGPTSLSAPGALTWSAKKFQPWAVSPDAAYVLGTSTGRTAVVRRMSDGAVVRTLPVPFSAQSGALMGWGDAATVLVTVNAKHGNTSGLEACPAAGGTCRLIGPYTLQGYSIADSQHETYN